MAAITSEGIYAITPSTPGVATIIESIVLIHAACILNDKTVATFLPPLSHSQITQSWQGFLQEAEAEAGAEAGAEAEAGASDNDDDKKKRNDDIARRIILVSVSRVSDRTTSATAITPPFPGDQHPWPILPPTDPNSSATEPLEISGVASVYHPSSQTGPFRALVQRLLVSPLHRRRGLATILLARLEQRALLRGWWNLMLDSEAGSVAAVALYPELGYRTLGVVPQYAVSPRDGRTLVDEVFFWKDLRGDAKNEEGLNKV